MKQLDYDFKIKINWNEYHAKFETFPQNRYLHYLIDPSFQGINTLSVLLFENETDREVHTKYHLITEEITSNNVIIDVINFFDQLIKIILKHVITLEALQLVKTINFSKNIRSDTFKWTIKNRCWSKNNTTSWFYQKHRKRYINIFHYWRGERNNFRFFKRHS